VHALASPSIILLISEKLELNGLYICSVSCHWSRGTGLLAGEGQSET
jgi:hypothetical protein